jgi:hypothetical protein
MYKSGYPNTGLKNFNKSILASSGNKIYNPSTFSSFSAQYNVSNADAMARQMRKFMVSFGTTGGCTPSTVTEQNDSVHLKTLM